MKFRNFFPKYLSFRSLYILFIYIYIYTFTALNILSSLKMEKIQHSVVVIKLSFRQTTVALAVSSL